MTRIDFYILPQQALDARLGFACKLTEKALGLGNQTLIYSANRDDCQQLDQLLWQFRPDSFLPHAVLPASHSAPIQLGHGEFSGDHHQLLINLSDGIPPFFSRFERMAEVVCQQPDLLNASRERFQFYRERGYELQIHKIKGAA